MNQLTAEDLARLASRVRVWLSSVGDGEEQRKQVAEGVRAWHRLKQELRRANPDDLAWRPISFEELAADIEAGRMER